MGEWGFSGLPSFCLGGKVLRAADSASPGNPRGGRRTGEPGKATDSVSLCVMPPSFGYWFSKPKGEGSTTQVGTLGAQ